MTYERVVRLATRIVYALVVTGTMTAYVLAHNLAITGRDRDYSDDRTVFTLYCLALIAGGLPALHKPTPRRLAIWAAVVWPAAVLYHVFIDPTRFDRPFDTVFYATLLVALGTSVLLMFASVAARAQPVETAPRRAHRMRSLMRAMLGIGIVVAILAFFPGTAVYDDANNCFGNALVAFGGHGGSHGCSSSYTKLAAVRPAGGPALALALVVLLAPALAVHANPGKRRGFLVWLIWVVAACVLPLSAFALTFHLDLFSRTVTLWAGTLVETGLLVLGVLFVFVLPAILITTREDKLPPARVERS